MLHCQSHENGDLKQGTDHTVDNLILTWPVVTLLELSFPTKVLVPGHAALKQSRAICALLRHPGLGRLGWLGPTQPGSNEHGGGGSQQSGRQHNTDFWKAENRDISSCWWRTSPFSPRQHFWWLPTLTQQCKQPLEHEERTQQREAARKERR